jgi:hypothetical protein
MAEHPQIALDPDVLAGKPVIRGTRLAVEFVIGLLAVGWTEARRSSPIIQASRMKTSSPASPMRATP